MTIVLGMDKFFTLFGLKIHYYGLIMAIAMLVGVCLLRKLCKKYNIKSDHIFDLCIIILPLAILGARAYYCIFSEYSYSFVEFWDIGSGGLAIYGGVIGGAIGVVIFCAIRKYDLLKVTDILVPALILGQAMGRWGNFINQEAFGLAVTDPRWQFFPFAVNISGQGWHLATFFYESMWNFIVFAVLMCVLKKSKVPGQTTAGYLILYCIGRVLIEGLRTDSLYWGAIRVSQLVSVIGIILGVVILVVTHFRAKRAVIAEVGSEGS